MSAIPTGPEEVVLEGTNSNEAKAVDASKKKPVKDRLSDAAELLNLDPEQLLNLELPELGALWRLESRARSQEYQLAKQKLLENLFGSETNDKPVEAPDPVAAVIQEESATEEAEPTPAPVASEELAAPVALQLEQIIARVGRLQSQGRVSQPELLKTSSILHAAQEATRLSIMCGGSDDLFAQQLTRHPLLGGAPPPGVVTAQIEEIKALLDEGLVTEEEFAAIKNRFLGITAAGSEPSAEESTADRLVRASAEELAKSKREEQEVARRAERERVVQKERDRQAKEEEERVRQAWMRERSEVRIVQAPQGATKEQYSWLKNIQVRGGSKEYTLVCPPFLVGPGTPPGMPMETVEECELAFAERVNVPPEQMKILALATRQGKGKRQFLLMHHFGDGVQFHENLQMIPLDDVTLIHYGAGSAFMGCAELTVSSAVHPVHPLAGQALLFCSVNPDNELAMEETQKLTDVLKYARDVNAELDARTKGNIVHGCEYCISSFPGEENYLRKRVVYATPTDIARTFDDDDVEDEAISLGCSWQTPEVMRSKETKDQFWWPDWKSNQIRAYLDGQTLLVYSRRDWENRDEEDDLVVSAEDNYSWPGKPMHLKMGEPISQYGIGQQREIEWLKHMVEEGEEWEDPESHRAQHVKFDEDRIQYRAIETLDEIRAVSKSGEIYRGR